MADLFGSETRTTTPSASPALGLFGQSVANLQGMGNPYAMSQPQWGALANVFGAVNNTPPNPVTGNPAWQGYLTNANALQGYQQGFTPQQVTASGPTTYAPVAGGQIGTANVGFSPMATSYGAVDVPGQAAVTTAQIDPTSAYNAAAQQLARFSTPQVQAAMQAAGMGRSGATGEAIGQAAASLALPINQQVLASQAQANQLDASIKARQGETQMLATVQSRLQAQQLTATSQSQYEQIGAQIAEVQAQLQQSSMNLNGQLQMQSALQAQNLGAASQTQANQLGLAAQQMNQNVGMQQYQANLGAGTAQQAQLANLSAQFPQLFNQNYLSGIAGAQAGMQAANFPQSLDISSQRQQQDFIARLLGAMPQASTQTTTNNPGALGLAGAGLGALSLLGGTGGIPSALGALGTGASSLYNSLTGTPNYNFSPQTFLDPASTLAGASPSFDLGSTINGLDPTALEWAF